MMIGRVLFLGWLAWGQTGGDPAKTEVWEPEPKRVQPGSGVPSDAIRLFDGGDLSEWRSRDGGPASWKVENSAFTVVPGTGDIETRRSFSDVQLHLEWRTPAKAEGEGQERGNSGVFLMQRYEVQILDSFENRIYSNGQAGSIYKQHIPLVNASKGPGEWQSYDIVFIAPRFADDGNLKSAGRITVFHNGVLIHNDVELHGSTAYIGEPRYQAHGEKEPLLLQDHASLVSFRNIWIRELEWSSPIRPSSGL